MEWWQKGRSMGIEPLDKQRERERRASKQSVEQNLAEDIEAQARNEGM